MQKVKKVCFYFLHKLWLTLAVILVLLATLMSVLRYSLPYADSYKHHIEQLIAERYHAQIQIGELSAAWQRFGPALVLKDIRLASEQEALQFNVTETRIRLDFWKSLLSMQLHASHFELVGLTYYTGSSQLFTPATDGQNVAEPLLDALEQLFLKQLKYFSVLNSKLIIQNEYEAEQPDIVINIRQLDWRNQANRHQGFGELSVADVTANNVSFILDLYGTEREQVFGQLYLESEQLDVLPLFRQLLPPTRRLDQANINFKAWGRIDAGVLRRIQVELADNALLWQRSEQKHTLRLGQGQLLWEPVADGWSLYSGKLTLADQHRQWPAIELQLHRHNQQWFGALEHFQLEALTPLSHLLEDDVEQLGKVLAYDFGGHLEQLLWQADKNNWYASGKFDSFTSSAVHDVPGISKLEGDFVMGNHFTAVNFQSTDSELTWDGLLANPVAYQSLQGRVYLHTGSDEQWQLTLQQLNITTPDFIVDAQAGFDHQQHLSILAKLQQLDAAKAAYYFPQRYMPVEVSDYLAPAIISGSVNNATLLWHGKVQDFPFAQPQGTFQIHALLEQGSFVFDPHWPMLTDLSADLWFENAGMLITARQGELAGLNFKQGITARIDDLFHADELEIQIKQQQDAVLVRHLIAQSPLEPSLGVTLQQLGISGMVDGEIRLGVDLHKPHVEASGLITLKNAVMNLSEPEMQLSAVTGELTFNNDQISADNLAFNWRDLPLHGSLTGKLEQEEYQASLHIHAQHQAAQLKEALQPQLPDDIAVGLAEWQLQLKLYLREHDFNYQADLTANLDNTELNLPAPYYKPSAFTGRVRASMTGNTESSQLSVNYADSAFFHALFLHQQQRITQAHLALGEHDPGLIGQDFTINAELDEADLLPWLVLIESQLAAAEQEHSIMPPLASIRGKVRQMRITPQIALHNTVFDMTEQPEHWLLQLNGKELSSHWILNKDWQQQGIIINLDYLHLPWPESASDETDEALLSTPADWLLSTPAVSVSCADCSIGSYRLGQVEMKAHSDANGWYLSQFNASYKRNALQLSGQWLTNQQLGNSSFNGRLTSPNIGAMLSEFQLTSAISGSRADIDFSLNWPGAPQQFSVAAFSGEVGFNLGEGSLTEVSDQGSRLFSIFSLDSLVRKLRLDFRDVFSKGFFYNKMSGKLSITDGIAQTSDTVIDGVPGNLSLQGYADLVHQKMDYQVAFAPKVTSSLPVIIAWMVNPVTGLAALALDEVFQSAEVISRINFTITGDFKNPVVTEVNRHSKEVPVPVRIAQPEPEVTEEQKPHG